MKRRTTLADVARAADVSMMTVSRAVNNKPGLSQELRQKILGIAAELDYHPSQVARSLATNQTATIGLVVPSITNPFYAPIARGVEDVAFEHGYSVFLVNTSASLVREAAGLDLLWTHSIDGAILCSFRLPEEQLINRSQHFPAVVLFNRELAHPLPNVVTICVNDQRAAFEAVRHFLVQGRRRIAYIGAPEGSYSSQRRLEGYCAALKNEDIAFDPSLVLRILPSLEVGKEAAQELLVNHPDIEAILAFNDMTALGVIQACQESGRKVPEDVAVIGADDIQIASLIRPKLTTSRINLDYVGRLAMRTILAVFEGKETPSTYTIEPELILRESA